METVHINSPGNSVIGGGYVRHKEILLESRSKASLRNNEP